MKKIIFSLIGIALFTLTQPAYAALSPLCQAALNTGALPPVSSHYTKRVLERATAGIVYAKTAQANPDFSQYLPNWTRVVSTTVLSLLDTKIRIIEQNRDLIENTACLRIDVFLMECKMDEVREEMNLAIQDQSFQRILRLKALLLFLNERLRILVDGARNPYVEDADWHRSYAFDDPSGQYVFAPIEIKDSDPVCGNNIREVGEECDGSMGCSASCQTDMCPFTSDYLPPGSTGFGCDEEVMGPRIAHPPTDEELAGLAQAVGSLNTFIANMQGILSLQTQIDALLGRSTTILTIPSRKHRTNPFNGCMQDICSDVSSSVTSCKDDKECQDSGLGDCISGSRLGTCLNDNTDLCTDDSQCASGCVQLKDTAWWELRGPFSIAQNEPRIMDIFRGLREYEGESRDLPDDWKLAEDFPPDQKDLAFKRSKQIIINDQRREAQPSLKIFSREQGREEAAIFAQGIDAQLQIAETAKPLRDAVGRFSLLAQDRQEGIRKFVMTFAYFIRRTCVFRPCNLLLEKIMRIALTDECFPYTNGEFLNDTCSDPRADQCIYAAKLDTEMGFPFLGNICK